MKRSFTVLMMALVAPACAASDDGSVEDGADDSFLGSGKADTGGVEEGSREAIAVLELANTGSLDVLVAAPPAGAGLSAKVADNLIGVRLGDDGVPGTDDDGVFETLAQLDAVPFVGPAVFGAMLDYARANVAWRRDWLAQGEISRYAMFGADGSSTPSDALQCAARVCCPSGCQDETFTQKSKLLIEGTNPGALSVLRRYADEGGGPFDAAVDDWDGTWSGRVVGGQISGAVLPGGGLSVRIDLDPGFGSGTCVVTSWSCTGTSYFR